MSVAYSPSNTGIGGQPVYNVHLEGSVLEGGILLRSAYIPPVD